MFGSGFHWASAVGAKRGLGHPLLQAGLVERMAAPNLDVVLARNDRLTADGALIKLQFGLGFWFWWLEHVSVCQLKQQVNQLVLLVLVGKEGLLGRLDLSEEAPLDIKAFHTNEASDRVDDLLLLLGIQLSRLGLLLLGPRTVTKERWGVDLVGSLIHRHRLLDIGEVHEQLVLRGRHLLSLLVKNVLHILNQLFLSQFLVFLLQFFYLLFRRS